MGFWENVVKSMRARKGEFTGTSGNEAKISERLSNNQTVNISAPTSTRTYTKGAQTRRKNGQFEKRSYTTGNIDIGDTRGNYKKKDYAKLGELESTAIKNARYDPTDNSLNITFTGGDKEYKYAADANDVKDFVNAPSKGQLIASWNRNGSDPHTYPGY